MQPLCQPFAVGTQSFFHLQHQTDSCRVCGTEFLGKCPECFLSLLKVCLFFFLVWIQWCKWYGHWTAPCLYLCILDFAKLQSDCRCCVEVTRCLESELEKISLRRVNYLRLQGNCVWVFTKQNHVFNFCSPMPRESVATTGAKGLTLPILVLEWN